jgi:hypothetical protein
MTVEILNRTAIFLSQSFPSNQIRVQFFLFLFFFFRPLDRNSGSDLELSLKSMTSDG